MKITLTFESQAEHLEYCLDVASASRTKAEPSPTPLPITPVATPVQPSPPTSGAPVQQPPVTAIAVPAPPVSQTPPPTAPASATVPTVPTTAVAPAYRLDQLQMAMAGLMDQGKDIQGILQAFGVDAIAQIPEDQYGALATKLIEMGAKL